MLNAIGIPTPLNHLGPTAKLWPGHTYTCVWETKHFSPTANTEDVPQSRLILNITEDAGICSLARQLA